MHVFMFLTEILLVLSMVRPWRPIGPYLRYQKSAVITLLSANYVQVLSMSLPALGDTFCRDYLETPM